MAAGNDPPVDPQAVPHARMTFEGRTAPYAPGSSGPFSEAVGLDLPAKGPNDIAQFLDGGGVIDWGDGTTTTVYLPDLESSQSTGAAHVYEHAAVGTYRVDLRARCGRTT